MPPEASNLILSFASSTALAGIGKGEIVDHGDVGAGFNGLLQFV